MLPFDTMGKRPIPCTSYGRWLRVCIDEFLAKVTKGVIHCIYKVVTQSSFGVSAE